MRFKSAIALAALAVFSASARAVSYDAVTDFSNPVFSYLWTPPGGATQSMSLFQNLDFTSESAYYNGLSTPNAAVITKNNNSTPATYATIVQPPGLLRFDPQLNSATLQFTAPSTDVWNISGLWQVIDTAPHNHNVGITIGGTSVESSNIGASFGQQIPFNFSAVPLTSGENVDFTVSSINGDFSFLSTGLEATISTVPEPTSLLLLTVPLLFLQRRRSAN